MVIDNYDSFTYNLCQVRCCCDARPQSANQYRHALAQTRTTESCAPCFVACPAQYLGDLGCEIAVFKNDEKSVDEIRAMNPRGILVSPGPGACETSADSSDFCRL